jgi:hypothetical protein
MVQSTTFDGNLVSGGTKPGGGIANGYSGSFFPNGGILVLESVTLIDNTNGLFSAAGDVHTVLHNTVLTQGSSLNCDGAGTPVTSNGFNFSSDNSCALDSTGDQKGSGLDPMLGLSQCDIRQCYHLPLAGSPLIDSGSGCPLRDQRGATRVGACDIGAVEFGGVSVTSQLTAPVNATQETIPLLNVAAFPVSGIVQIDDELLSYVGVTAEALIHAGRGLRGTAADDHIGGAIVRFVAPLCTGDCSGDAMVAVNELVLGVGIALDRTPLSQCIVFDEGADGNVAVNELVQAVAFALRGCPNI